MIDLNKDEERGVQLFMAEHSVSREEAVRRILQDWLISHGYVSFDPDDEPLLNTGSERGAA